MSRSFVFPLLLGLSGLLAACNAEKTVGPVPVTPAAPVISDGSLMEPGRPQLAGLPTQAALGVQSLTWNMWWGENGRRWVVYVNGANVKSGTLTAATATGHG